jgi:hypothetical protein
MKNGTVDQSGNLVDGASTLFYCVDFENDVYIPSPVYTANLTPIFNGSDLSNTVYGRADSAWAPGDPSLPVVFTNTSFSDSSGSFTPSSALQRYQMAAWLISQYDAPGADKTAIQDGIWSALEVSPPVGDSGPAFPAIKGKTKTDMNLLLSEAANYVSGPNSVAKQDFFDQFKIVTQVGPIYLNGPNQIQEFIIINPEPSTLAVLTGGILGLLLWRKRRAAAA